MAKKTYYQRSDGLYEAIRVINGKRKAFRGRTPREVEQKMIAYQEETERGRTFASIADEWKAVHFPTLAPNTLKGYRPAYARAKEYFGEMPVKQIKAPTVKKFITDFSHSGADQVPRAQKTVTNQLLVLNLIMSYAAELGEIEYNPCINVSIPRGLSKGRRNAASKEDEKKIKESTGLWLFPFLILYTGLRKGEALALTFGDIDRKNKQITVTKSVYHINNKPYLKKPKTEAGIRVVPILSPLLPHLPKNRKKTDFVFSADGGKTPLTEVQYQNLWDKYVSDTGIQCTAHQLRHSYATMLFECGIDVKDAQDLLGHSTSSMTQDIYTHIRNEHRKMTAVFLDEKLEKQGA